MLIQMQMQIQIQTPTLFDPRCTSKCEYKYKYKCQLGLPLCKSKCEYKSQLSLFFTAQPGVVRRLKRLKFLQNEQQSGFSPFCTKVKYLGQEESKTRKDMVRNFSILPHPRICDGSCRRPFRKYACYCGRLGEEMTHSIGSIVRPIERPPPTLAREYSHLISIPYQPTNYSQPSN